MSKPLCYRVTTNGQLYRVQRLRYFFGWQWWADEKVTQYPSFAAVSLEFRTEAWANEWIARQYQNLKPFVPVACGRVLYNMGK